MHVGVHCVQEGLGEDCHKPPPLPYPSPLRFVYVRVSLGCSSPPKDEVVGTGSTCPSVAHAPRPQLLPHARAELDDAAAAEGSRERTLRVPQQVDRRPGTPPK